MYSRKNIRFEICFARLVLYRAYLESSNRRSLHGYSRLGRCKLHEWRCNGGLIYQRWALLRRHVPSRFRISSWLNFAAEQTAYSAFLTWLLGRLLAGFLHNCGLVTFCLFADHSTLSRNIQGWFFSFGRRFIQRFSEPLLAHWWASNSQNCIYLSTDNSIIHRLLRSKKSWAKSICRPNTEIDSWHDSFWSIASSVVQFILEASGFVACTSADKTNTGFSSLWVTYLWQSDRVVFFISIQPIRCQTIKTASSRGTFRIRRLRNESWIIGARSAQRTCSLGCWILPAFLGVL